MMKRKTQKKTRILLALVGILALGACGSPDADAPKNSVNDSRGNSAAEAHTNTSDKDEKDRKLDGLFEYTLIEEENTVLLTKYIGDSEAVTVYGSYKISGKEYTTRLQDGVDETHTKSSPFWDNTTIKSLTFVDGVKVNNCSSYFDGCTNLETIDLNGLDTSESSRFCAMFAECRSLQSVDLTPLNMDKLTELYGMFSGCESLTELDFSMVDTSNVISFDSLFSECKSLQTLNIKGMNTGSATYLASVFDGCESLTSIDVSGFDTSNVDAMPAMFRGCESLTDIDVSNFDTSKVVGMGAMFAGCKNLTGIDFSNFDTSSLRYMDGMFSGCENLTTVNLDSFDTVHVNSMASMFEGCKSLKQLDISHFTTEIALTYTYDMFKNCDSLTVVYVNQDFYNFVYSDKVKNNNNMFDNCPVEDFTVK